MASLDGLRAISIVLVLLGHLSGTRGFGRLQLGIGDYAHLGVVVFFVISGFLITSLLISEQDRTGAVSLRRFYERRIVRIFPALYCYLGIITVLWLAGHLPLKSRDVWGSWFYVANFIPDPAWHIGHLWSLSVEEQFYLLWPFAFVALGLDGSAWAAAVMIVVPILARLVNRFWLVGTPFHDLPMFPMVADSLAAGCLLARLKDWLSTRDWYLRLMQWDASAVVLALVLLLNRYLGYTVVLVFGTTLINLGIALLIHRSVYHAGDAAGRVLNWRPLAFVGTISYSLYLWQQPFLNRQSDAWINTFPQNLLLTVCAALASYFLLEKPLLALRQRLHSAPPQQRGKEIR